jgi:hypothetical protein
MSVGFNDYCVSTNLQKTKQAGKGKTTQNDWVKRRQKKGLKIIAYVRRIRDFSSLIKLLTKN